MKDSSQGNSKTYYQRKNKQNKYFKDLTINFKKIELF